MRRGESVLAGRARGFDGGVSEVLDRAIEMSPNVAVFHYRKALLQAGVELWEARPDPAYDRSRAPRGLGYSESRLHTNAFAVDRRYLFVGSFNWDPRSVDINTELGVIIKSPKLTNDYCERIELNKYEKTYEVVLNESFR